ncbi:hypothetical protein BUALT_Bualt04G0087600 [Buddleja alternifolia]|uniref:RING-CH-type domain-containing protein n=1 Tax=Buddleja alternifolia TaxID=168488 RepID=A0AAV6XY86_9LAMI|nr:hypothetical protein BUALT_Bualt04G0087600 [Buddleja alternifolia]
MGDHFVLLVDRLLTESTLEAAIQSKNRLQHVSNSEMTNSFSFNRMDINVGSSPMKLAECRICHDEDEDSNMEVPCSCRGSLKYAHRRCVQRWCNEKGDTTCEICLQLFKPGYTAPPPLFHYGGIPMNFRGNWEISRRDLHNPQYISMISSHGNFLDANFDEYPMHASRSIFVVLLVLRHTLPFIIYGAGEYSISLVMLVMLRIIGILLPVYIMLKALTAIQRRRNRQDSQVFPLDTFDQENELPPQQPESHFIHVP